MDALHLLGMAGAAIGGALVGALGCHWHLNRTITLLSDRLERAEQARNGAIERSAHAREQIAQLHRAIAELRKAHNMPAAPVEDERTQRAARAEAALKKATAEDPVAAARRESSANRAFAPTQTLDRI